MNIPFFPVISFLLICTSICVLSQPSIEGFISLDCGLANNNDYTDSITGLPYTSDDKYINNAGSVHAISSNLIFPSLETQYRTLRSFPNGTRNCYTLQPVIQGQKYVIRAGFMYGNYDGLNSARTTNSLQFDLHLDVNKWTTMNITGANFTFYSEVITVAVNDFFSVCLVNTGFGTPFISLLELRPLNSSMYELANATHSLVLGFRLNIGPPTGLITRYPSEPHDLVWESYIDSRVWKELSTDLTISSYKELSTDLTVSSNIQWSAPSVVLQTAVTPVNSSILQISLSTDNPTSAFFFIFHFAELVNLSNNDLRAFDMYYNGRMVYEYYVPDYLSDVPLYTTDFLTGTTKYTYAFNATRNSTLPPLINAMETYEKMLLTNLVTELAEAKAMMEIKELYQIKKNWMGDPCNPIEYAWQGLTCSNGNSNPHVLAVNLSFSELAGPLSAIFSNLREIKSLDLSYNHLNGTIPDYLATMDSLGALNLAGNNFTGDIPDALLKKANSGLLDFRYDTYTSPSKTKKTKSNTTLIIIIAIPVFFLFVLAALIIWFIAFRTSSGLSRDAPMVAQPQTPIQNINRRITPNMPIEANEFQFFQLESMTQNFTREIGRGGFGTVYYGKLEDGTEIAAKISSQSSAQNTKQFLAEARSLTRVHHKNLVSLIGYCMEKNSLALIYEYMPQGSLRDHLKGRIEIPRVLSWRQRLQIALDSAKGLDYIHTGCEMIHRDIKSSNILLGPNLEAKISDFGLSKFTGTATQSSYSGICGTPGYIDPEAQKLLKFTDKSDVYSFGVVLLELTTGEPPLVSGQENLLSQRVSTKLARGNIDAIVDPRLQGNYHNKSAWKIVDVAMRCVAPSSYGRPAMAEVVTELKASLDLEIFRDKSGGADSDQSTEVEFKTMTFAPSAR